MPHLVGMRILAIGWHPCNQVQASSEPVGSVANEYHNAPLDTVLELNFISVSPYKGVVVLKARMLIES